MLSQQNQANASTGHRTRQAPPLRPFPRLRVVDRAPPLKPLIMGTTVPPVTTKPNVRTRWQTSSMPRFPIEPANDPIERLIDDDRASMVLLALVVCVTLTVAVLGFGLQVFS